MKRNRIKVTLRQQSANAMKDFIYADGRIVGESTFSGDRRGNHRYRIELHLPTGRATGYAKTRSGVASAVSKRLNK
jgi:hypothetical protein